MVEIRLDKDFSKSRRDDIKATYHFHGYREISVSRKDREEAFELFVVTCFYRNVRKVVAKNAKV